MPFDIASAIAVKDNEKGAEQIDFGFDINSAKPVSTIEEKTFEILDSSRVSMDIVKGLFRGVERIPAGIGSGIEYMGRDIMTEAKAETKPLISFPGLRSIPWMRVRKDPIYLATDDFFYKFGDTLAEIGKTAKNFYNEAANKGIESPNPAVMLGWKHPFRKTAALASESFPMLGVAAGVTAVTKNPIIGAATFFPTIAGDMYEDAINNGVDPIIAGDMAATTGAVQTALETIPLTGWMKGGHMLKRVFRTALQEGLIEEGSQQIFDNSLRIIGWQEPRPIWDRVTDGLAESILAGTVSGGALGIFQAPHIDDIRYDLHNQVIMEGLKQGLNEEQIAQTIDKVDEVINKTIGVEPVVEEPEPEAPKPPIVAPTGEGKVLTIADVENLISEKSKQYGSKNAFLASDEYKTLYPQVEKIYKEAKGEFVGKATKAMEESGVKVGDRVSTLAQGFAGGTSVNGTIIMRNGVPYVKLDSSQMTSQGYRKQIQWNKGWKLSQPTVGEPPIKPITPAIPKIKKQKPAKPLSLLSIIKQKGGIDPTKASKDYNINIDFKQSGLLSILKKGGQGLDDMAASLAAEGYIIMPEDTMNTADFLMQILKDKTQRIIKTANQLEKEYEEGYNKWQEKQHAKGYTEAEIKQAETELTPDLKKEVEGEITEEFGEVETQQVIPGTEIILPETSLKPPLQTEMFQEKGELFKKKPPKPSAAYSIAPGEEAPQEQKVFGRGEPKYIPPVTAIGKMSWEKAEAWVVNLGRDITGVFEREIGPKLQVSKRFKKFLGVYYPSIGPSGLIRVKTLADEMTLFHEAGHFLDDSLSSMTGWNVGQRGTVREELLKVTHYVTPFEERRIPVMDKETGIAKRNKRTGEILTKFDTYTNYRRESKELFAQYLALYVNNPTKAKELAPTFTDIVENEITKDKEFAYIVTKLREFEAQMKPLKEYVNALRKIPDFQKNIKDWVEQGNLLQQLWRSKVGDKVWDVYSKAIENLAKKTGVGKAFFEKGGLNDVVFEILRQRRKLIQGQQARLREELIEPISELNEQEQQSIAESLQRFDEMTKDTPLNNLTEEARKELALWGNEARKLGLLNDEIFWNNVGQYFPFFYETKEFEKNKRSFGYFPSKAIRANFSALKHKLTDEEFGRKVLEAQYGTWPSGKEKIAKYSKEELVELGRNAREELGLMKTAAYPLQRRLFGMIEMIYTVKAFNNIATIPGIIGHKGSEGFDKMPTGKKYGVLAEQYVPIELVKEVSKWNALRSEIGEIWRNANTIWKIFKVPYNPAAVSRNIITNALMAYMGDVPVYNPAVTVKGVKSFIARDEAYKILRDRGLYHNTYSEQELKNLAFQIDQDPNNPYKQIMIWANNLGQVLQSPARLYGAIEDASKTVIARYVLDQGGTPEQAVKFADKLLFDYSQTSEVVGYARQGFFPFITWSAKILPRLVEFAIRKPEKFIMMVGMVELFNVLSRSMLGVSKDDEERLKPDYIRGKTVLLMHKRDVNDDLNWIDLTYFFPWGGWLPVERGKLAIPQTITMSNPLLTLYNAYVLNYDPFYGEIAPSYLTDDEQVIEKGKYVAKSLLPQILMITPGRIINSTKPDKFKRQREPAKVLFGELTGVKFTQDISAYRQSVLKRLQQDFYKGRVAVKKQLQAEEITKEQAQRKIEKLQDKFEREKEKH